MLHIQHIAVPIEVNGLGYSEAAGRIKDDLLNRGDRLIPPLQQQAILA